MNNYEYLKQYWPQIKLFLKSKYKVEKNWFNIELKFDGRECFTIGNISGYTAKDFFSNHKMWLMEPSSPVRNQVMAWILSAK